MAVHIDLHLHPALSCGEQQYASSISLRQLRGSALLGSFANMCELDTLTLIRT